MKLLVDIGNSRVKTAWLDGQEMRREESFEWDRAQQGDSVADGLSRILGSHPVEQIWVASVAGEAIDQSLEQSAHSRKWPAPQFVRTTAMAAGVSCGYQRPENMGVDRWMGVIAAWHRVQGPVCVVDSGTALTVDWVDSAAQHRGGLIVPGLTLMREAVYTGTGVPRRPRQQAVGAGLGRDTGDAVYEGALAAARGAVRELWLLANEEGGSPAIVLAGGDAELLRAGLQKYANVVLMPELVLQGLAAVCLELT